LSAADGDSLHESRAARQNVAIQVGNFLIFSLHLLSPLHRGFMQ